MHKCIRIGVFQHLAKYSKHKGGTLQLDCPLSNSSSADFPVQVAIFWWHPLSRIFNRKILHWRKIYIVRKKSDQ